MYQIKEALLGGPMPIHQILTLSRTRKPCNRFMPHISFPLCFRTLSFSLSLFLFFWSRLFLLFPIFFISIGFHEILAQFRLEYIAPVIYSTWLHRSFYFLSAFFSWKSLAVMLSAITVWNMGHKYKDVIKILIPREHTLLQYVLTLTSST